MFNCSAIYTSRSRKYPTHNIIPLLPHIYHCNMTLLIALHNTALDHFFLGIFGRVQQHSITTNNCCLSIVADEFCWFSYRSSALCNLSSFSSLKALHGSIEKYNHMVQFLWLLASYNPKKNAKTIFGLICWERKHLRNCKSWWELECSLAHRKSFAISIERKCQHEIEHKNVPNEQNRRKKNHCKKKTGKSWANRKN